MSGASGIGVDIGDTPAAFPAVSNAQLVERAVRWAEESGRPVAPPRDVRARFGRSAAVAG